jgi:gp16 family phage-associated protein
MKEALVTPELFKARLRAQGKTIAAWSMENGFNPLDTYRVLNGVYKGRFGTAHDIAVRAGIKVDPQARAA